MGLWRVPEKILLPAEPGGVGTFEFNGRRSRTRQAEPSVAPDGAGRGSNSEGNSARTARMLRQ
jgi:hypothetical protein